MNDIDINIDRFKEFVDSWKNGYRFALFSYVALKQQDDLTMIIAASIRLMPMLDTTKIMFLTHDSKSIAAGITYWEIEDDNTLGFLSQISDGFIQLPDGKRMQFCNDEDNNIWSQFNPGTDLIKNNQPRTVSLKLSGSIIDNFFENAAGLEELDGELQSSTIPFNGLSDLCGTLDLNWYQLTNPAGQKSELLVHAEQLLVLDRTKSIISDGKARINLLLAPGLTRSQLNIGIRPWDGNYTGRKSISGNDIKWFEDDGASGSVEISVGDTPAVLVLLSHNNKLFDRWWVFDPAKHINHHYAAYKAIDSDLTVLKRFLSGQSKNPADDLESGIALLLGLFGFTVFHFGLTPSLQEAPDLLAFSEANQLAVIECTTGIPNEKNKVSKLIVRAEKIRTSLVNSGNAHIEVLPVIVTTSARDSVPKDIEEAGKHGVLVIAKEDIDSLIERIQFPPPLPSKLFVEAKSLLPLSELPSQA